MSQTEGGFVAGTEVKVETPSLTVVGLMHQTEMEK